MLMKILFAGAGGALGAVLRYVVSGLDYRFSGGVFPVGTLIVNLSGSLLIGFLWGVFEQAAVSSNVRVFIFIGVLGGYTTFSTFALENFSLMRDGEINIALLNILLSNAGGILLVYAGYSLARLVPGILKA
jgi:CrcB protein